MMRYVGARIRNWPIGRKLIFTGLLTNSFALLAAGISIIGYQWFQYRGDIASELESAAQIIAVNTSAPLIFGDLASANRTLAPLAVEPRVAEVAIYTAGGKLFASYIRTGLNHPLLDSIAQIRRLGFSWLSIRVSRSITVDGENVGSVYIRSDMPDVAFRLIRSASIVGVVMFGAVLMAFFANSSLQRVISRPIQHLADVAKVVSAGNYAVRAVRESSDEIGALTDTFNSMLQQIENRDQHLEAAVDARTQDLTRSNKELVIARDKADEGGRLKGEFLANMSHEIRTPMNIIIGMTQLTLDTQLDARQRRHLSMVRSSADALLTIINDILDFSKIEAGKLELDPVTFGLAECIRDRMAILSVKAEQKGLELEVRIDRDVPETIVSDPVRIIQVVVNLIENALKFTSAGKIEIRVYRAENPLETEIADTVLLGFSITDTGIGIAPDKLASIFEAFTQADGSTTRRYGGTGLGLTICRQLVAMMGGQIGVESELGKGSTFKFTIRAGVAKADPVAQPSERPANRTRAIVIMPQQEQRDILYQMLSNWHIDAASVDSPAAALEVLKWSSRVGRPFSFALIDAGDVEPDGGLLKQIRANPDLASLSIVLLDTEKSAARIEHAGADARLAWPVSQSDLLQVITGFQLAEDASQSLHALSSAVTNGTSGPWAGLRRVLVAEDNPMNEELVLTLLETRISAASIQVAHDGQEALEAALEAARETSAPAPLDLILMDIQMPRMNGVEVTKAIRASEANSGRHVRIIALTAHAMEGDREIYIHSGMDGYVSKPLDKEALFREIERVMNTVYQTAPRPAGNGL
jgi:signal transduction histidine kinase/DNA-binding response OmpR family regulator